MDLSSSDTLYEKYPELKNDGIGAYSITALQVFAAVTKQGLGEVVQFANSSKEYIVWPDNLGRTALHYAAYIGNTEVMEFLLSRGMDVNLKTHMMPIVNQNIDQKWVELKNFIMRESEINKSIVVTGSPLQFAVSAGSLEAVKFLIGRGAEMINTSVDISAVVNKSEETFVELVDIFLNQKSKNEISAFSVSTLIVECIKKNKPTYIKHLMNYDVQDIGELQCNAALRGRTECLKVLASRGINLNYRRGTELSLLDSIFFNISNPESFLASLLDDKITYEDDSRKKISFDFTILESNGMQMTILQHICNSSNSRNIHELLSHPLIDIFLKLKWDKVRKFFITQFLIYLIFVVSLSTYLLTVVLDGTRNIMIINGMKYLLIVSALISFLHSFFQFIVTFRRSSSKLEIVINMMCTLLAIAVVFNSGKGYPNESKNIPLWILHSTSVAIFLAWLQLMLMVGRFPRFGPYSLMFTVVLQNVIKVLITFVCLIIGFALSFTIQFRDLYHFQNPFLSIVKTTVMMMGEYEYSDLFNNINNQDANYRLPVTSRIIFLLFIALVSVVLMNLMIGLAVSDIQSLQEHGHAKTYLKQTDFIKGFEEMVFLFEKVSRRFRNCCGGVVVYLRSHAKIRSTVEVDSNKKRKFYGLGLSRDYVDSLFIKVAKRKKPVCSINMDNLEQILSIIKSELEKV